jgi:hypothetical protein
MYRIRPEALGDMAPLLALSVGAAVTLRLYTRTIERLAWLDVVYGILKTNVRTLQSLQIGILIFLGSRNCRSHAWCGRCYCSTARELVYAHC